MTEENERRPRGLYEKINALRGDVIKLDWTKDGYASFGKTSYKYLPTDKIKANLAPYFHKRGLELQTRFYGLQFLPAVGNMTQHVVLQMDATIIDIDSGDSITDTVYGEAADSGDKAIGKAQTYAVKSWASNKFLIADGMDPDDIEAPGSGFKPKTPQESEGVRSKILEQGIKPTVPVPAVPAAPHVPAPVPTPVAAEKPAEPVPEAPAPVPSPVPSPAVEALEGQPAKFKLSAAHQKAIKKITDAWDAALAGQKVGQEEYDAMKKALDAVASPADTMSFINTYKREF